jgi:hypothetical protein
MEKSNAENYFKIEVFGDSKMIGKKRTKISKGHVKERQF